MTALTTFKGFFYYNLSIESDASVEEVLLKARAFEPLAQKAYFVIWMFEMRTHWESLD